MTAKNALSERRDASTGPPETRHVDVVATANDRCFVRAFLVTLCLLVLTVLILAILVDPYGGFGTGLIQPLVPNDRDEKAAAYARMAPPADALVLGSSRVMKLSPQCLEKASGLRTYNFGLNSARAEDFLAVLRFAQKRGGLKHIWIGVDPEALHSAAPVDDRLVASRSLAPLLPPSIRPSKLGTIKRQVAGALAWDAIASATRSIWQAVAGRGEPSYIWDASGLIHYGAWERESVLGLVPNEELIAQTARDYERRYAGFVRLSPERIGSLTEFLRLSRESGIVVDAFIPPLHPALESGLSTTTLAARTRDTVELLDRLSREGFLHFHKLPTLESFGGDPRLFFDGAHMMSGNAARLVNTLFGRNVCDLQ